MPLNAINGLRGLHGGAWPCRKTLWRPRALTLKGAARIPRPSQIQRKQSGLNSATVTWLVIALLSAIVVVALWKPTPLVYLLVVLGIPFAFLTPSTALATFIITVLVPAAFGEHNIVAYLLVLLLVPMAYHALLHLTSSLPPSQRVLVILQGILCLVMVLPALASQTPGQIADSMQIYVGPIALLLAAVPRWTMSDRRFLFRVLVFAGAIVAVKTNLRFASHTPVVTYSEDVLRGTFDKLDPNYMSCYIGFGLVCALYLLMETLSSKRKRWMVLAWLAPIAVSLVAMGQLASRGMTLALLAGLAVLVATTPVKLPRRAGILVLVLMVGLGVALSGGFDLLWARFLKDDVKTASNRTEITAVALRLFADRSLDQQLLGDGSNSSLRAMGVHTHNAFTEQLMDYGIVGASCFAGLFLCLGAACARTEGPTRASGLVLLCYTAAASMSVSPFRFAWGWVALACILPCWQFGRPSAANLPRHARA